MTESLLSLLLLISLIWYWQDSLKAREAGIAAARTACRRENLQFLDDTVAQNSLRLARDAHGHVRLRRSFAFEFSITGDDRHPGHVILIGSEVILLDTSAHRHRPATEQLPDSDGG